MSTAWHYGIPVLALILGVGALNSAIRTEARRLPGLRSYWTALVLPLFWTGDALVGEGRPWSERAVKGALAVMVWTSVAIAAGRRRRYRSGGSAAPRSDVP